MSARVLISVLLWLSSAYVQPVRPVCIYCSLLPVCGHGRYFRRACWAASPLCRVAVLRAIMTVIPSLALSRRLRSRQISADSYGLLVSLAKCSCSATESLERMFPHKLTAAAEIDLSFFFLCLYFTLPSPVMPTFSISHHRPIHGHISHLVYFVLLIVCLFVCFYEEFSS